MSPFGRRRPEGVAFPQVPASIHPHPAGRKIYRCPDTPPEEGGAARTSTTGMGWVPEPVRMGPPPVASRVSGWRRMFREAG
ncbi:hypothetical protein GCM10023259_038080 [Thermocatellispora tengchongensis]